MRLSKNGQICFVHFVQASNGPDSPQPICGLIFSAVQSVGMFWISSGATASPLYGTRKRNTHEAHTMGDAR